MQNKLWQAILLCIGVLAYSCNKQNDIAPIASFGVTNDGCQATCTVTFNNTSLGNGNAYIWDFGDGATSNETSPQHAYSTPDTYSVKLKVQNEVGYDELTKTVTIAPPTNNTQFSKCYVGSITITQIPDQRPDGSAWDNGATSPYNNADVEMQLYDAANNALQSADNFFYDLSSDDLPVSTTFLFSNIYMTELSNTYRIELYDVDYGSRELVGTLSFKPNEHFPLWGSSSSEFLLQNGSLAAQVTVRWAE